MFTYSYPIEYLSIHIMQALSNKNRYLKHLKSWKYYTKFLKKSQNYVKAM